MQILHHFIQQTWTSGDFGIYKGPGTSPPQIRRDNCIVVMYFLFNPSLLNTKLLVLSVKKQQLELDMELLTGSKLEKEYIKAVYCHPAYLSYMQSTSCNMLILVKHSWNQDYVVKYQWPQICRWHHPYGRKWRGTQEPFDEVKEESEKAGLKLNIQKMKIMASVAITSWQIGGETIETSDRLYLFRLQNHCRWWLAMKLKDACSLEEKLTNLDSILKSRDITLLAKVCIVKAMVFSQ